MAGGFKPRPSGSCGTSSSPPPLVRCVRERHATFTEWCLLIKEFVTRLTKDEKHKSNATDLDRFLERRSHGAVKTVTPNVLHGPFTVPAAPLFKSPTPPLFVGKAVCHLRER